jgi:hypothetical protein
MRTLLVLAMLLFSAGAAEAQQRPTEPAPRTPQVDTLTPAQRALERLRAQRAPGAPDTVRAAPDSIRPQGLQVSGRTPGAGATPSQIERDDIMRRLLELEGYVATEYRGDSARFLAEINRLELRGNPQVAREGNQLVADSAIIYSQAQSLACGYGNPVLHAVGQSEPLASDTVCFDVERRLGRAFGASTRVQEGATWNVRCDAYFVGDQLYCHDAIFTDCDEPYPHQHYAFGAKELKAIRGNVIVARNVTLRFADVPVFWLPYMVQSLSRGRRSGILMPRFGINDIASTSSRYNRRIEDLGFYWAVNDYMGAELAMDWFSNNWTALRGSFDYNWLSRFLTGGLTYRQYWRDEGGRELTLATSNRWQPDERTNVSVTANYASSPSFVRRGTIDPRELNRSIDSYASVGRRFDWGSASLGASRKQFLSNNTVTWQRPSLSLSFSPLTFFEALPGEESWYSNMSWSGSGDLRVDRTDVDLLNPDRLAQTRQQSSSNVSSRLSLGRFSISQSANLSENVLEGRELPGDSLPPLAGYREQSGRWSTSLNFEQRLIGTSTLTPGVSVQGRFVRSDSTGNQLVSAPMRVDLNSALRVEMFGFWPGVGPFERFRHRVSPSVTYSYSPATRADSLQSAIFREEGVLEQNRISIGLTQTFEAKYRSRTPQPAEGPGADMVAGDTTSRGAGADTLNAPAVRAGAQDTLGGRVLTRRQQVATVSLLAISTEAVTYDFVRARTGDGLVNTELRNSVQSDLLRGMQLSVVHDLFRQIPGDSITSERRSFRPHLRQLNASFSINGNSWLFRVLRLGRADTVSTNQGGTPTQQGDSLQAGPAVDRTESDFGMIGTSRRTAEGSPRGAAGSWNASINYSLVRPRAGSGAGDGNQMVTGNVSFQPTENWTVRWNTGYSFTAKEFASHMLTLTRTLHDWDANFDFVKAQNGNFSMQFRVHLRANPDVKLDYSQSDVRGLQQQ